MNSSSEKLVEVCQSLEVNTYADLLHTAEILKEKAISDENSSEFVFMACLCMFAFSMEAYTNYVGPKLFPVEWLSGEKPIERSSILKKLRKICSRLSIVINENGSQWKLLVELVQFRDKLAHGKQETIVETKFIPLQEEMTDYLAERLSSSLYKTCNATYVRHLEVELRNFLTTIHEALQVELMSRGIDEYLDSFGSFGMGHGSATLL